MIKTKEKKVAIFCNLLFSYIIRNKLKLFPRTKCPYNPKTNGFCPFTYLFYHIFYINATVLKKFFKKFDFFSF